MRLPFLWVSRSQDRLPDTDTCGPRALGVGKVRRVPGRRNVRYKLKTYKKVYVRLSDDKTQIAPPDNAHALA